MDTLLVGGDHYTDHRGLPVTLDGVGELIQRALIRLSVRRGSFAPDPRLGSELYKLRGAPPAALDRLALSYVQEALAPLALLAVEAVTVTPTGEDTLGVAVTVRHRQQTYGLEVQVA